MSKITVAFIRAAMIYFVLAMLLGIRMSRTGASYPSMPMHVHFNLLGWMSMMIYGVAYHILPRFSGQPLWSEKLSKWHFWLANIGLIGMVFGWFLIGSAGGGGALLYISSLIEGVSIIFFAVNMIKTVKAAPPVPPRPPARPRPPKKPPVKAEPAAAAPAAKSPKAEVSEAKKAPSAAAVKEDKKAAPTRKKAVKTVKKEEEREKKEETPKEGSTLKTLPDTPKKPETVGIEDKKRAAKEEAPEAAQTEGASTKESRPSPVPAPAKTPKDEGK